MRVALVQQGVSLASASVMEVVKGARWKIALGVLRASLASAYPMEVGVAANSLSVQKVLKGAQCSVKLTVVAEGAQFWDAQKVQKGALHFVRATVVGKDVHQKDALRASTGELYFVLVMVGAKDVLCPDVPRVPGVVQATVYVMVVEKGASLQAVQKVHKEALIFARHMVEGNDALGDSWVLSSAVKDTSSNTSTQTKGIFPAGTHIPYPCTTDNNGGQSVYSIGHGNACLDRLSLPEGRVHGGSLMAMLRGGTTFGTSNNTRDNSGQLEPEKSFPMSHGWV
ncbi:UNVERIFIED_CONTAM: hypothetical protein Sangu_2219700 [Sesamum angustifolium]|uniref:Uncharacterized protein n=1 Tax=Sesamum angustifolium TaxID=2727405 RepID=A0AAW2LI32_9LAMI